jgi:RNA polymerase sigma-70 factor (ECF subfamily)
MADRLDQELMSAAGRGDRDAFGVLVRRYHRSVMQFACRFLGISDRSTAEDLAQEVFLAAWRAAPSFRPRAGVRVFSWLLRITTNICLNHRRSVALRTTAPIGADGEPCTPAHGQPEAVVAIDERARQVRAAIAQLPPAQRTAILLREFHDLSYAEIAEVIDTSVSAVESLLVRARRNLSVNLAEWKVQNVPQVSSGLRAESL